MNIDKLFSDTEYLEKEIHFFITKKQLKKTSNNIELVNSHLKKADQNHSRKQGISVFSFKKSKA